jgi:hypothetical protein
VLVSYYCFNAFIKLSAWPFTTKENLLGLIIAASECIRLNRTGPVFGANKVITIAFMKKASITRVRESSHNLTALMLSSN